jgi:hypothetical protein
MKTTRWMAAIVAGTALAIAAAGPGAHAQEQKAPAKAGVHKATPQKTFTTAEEAVKALVEAVRAGNAAGMVEVIGPNAKSWLFTGDKVADTADWKAFIAAYDRNNAVRMEGDAKAVLFIGDDWPFPAPIVKKGATWSFDANAGREEVTNRRVGRNELDTIQTLLAIVDAQREYATKDADGNGTADYARRFISSPGKKDGLYWPVKEGEPQSPLGPLAAQASQEGYAKKAGSGKPQPYHGYLYRMLTRQGKNASGGAYDYIVKGRMMGGFAVVAYPARYGVSGVMTFVVNHDGVVFQKDLGSKTPSAAGSMKEFNPDKTWVQAQ